MPCKELSLEQTLKEESFGVFKSILLNLINVFL